MSRTRNQLWVVHSLNPDIDLKPDDLRLKLIKYAINPNRDHDTLLSISESPFEMEVMKILLAESYKVIPQFKVGSYRIDMVVQYRDKKIALECDGERFHTSDNLNNDLARQAILERLGWRFIRIRGSEYYRYPEQTMKNVLDSLLKYGIHPSYEDVESDSQENDTLLNVVKIKASEFRNEVVEQIEHNDSPEVVYSKPDEDSTDQLISMLDSHKDNLEYCEDKAVNASICTDNSELEQKEVIATEPLILIDQNVVKNEVELTVEKSELAPTFDFRGRQKTGNQIKEKPRAEEVKSTESTGLSKPKFDFRKVKA